MGWIKKIIWDCAIKKVIDFPFDFSRTILVIVILELLSLLLYPAMKLWALLILLPVAVLFAFACKIVFRGSVDTEPKEPKELQKLRQENIYLIEKLEAKADEINGKDKVISEKDRLLDSNKESLRQKDLHVEELKRRGIKVIDSERVFLLSLLKLQLSEVVHIDCLKENGNLMRFDRLWDNEKKIDSDVYRIITSVKINKTIYVGFELNEVRVLLDGKYVKYVLPPVKITSDIKEDNEEWMPEVMLSPERSIWQKAGNIMGKPFGFYECEWKMINPDVKKPATIVEDIQKIRTEMIRGASSSLSIGKAEREVKMLVKEQIIEKQIKFKGYEPVEEDSLPEGADYMSLTDFVKRIEFILPS
ncbi:MAG: hypothetical protein WC637_15725 [Victivallales bacterium]|jgi:hypothetical protein